MTGAAATRCPSAPQAARPGVPPVAAAWRQWLQSARPRPVHRSQGTRRPPHPSAPLPAQARAPAPRGVALSPPPQRRARPGRAAPLSLPLAAAPLSPSVASRPGRAPHQRAAPRSASRAVSRAASRAASRLVSAYRPLEAPQRSEPAVLVYVRTAPSSVIVPGPSGPYSGSTRVVRRD